MAIATSALLGLGFRSQLCDAAEFATFLPREQTVCDLGCGDGWNLKRFQQRGFQVIGVDPDPVSRDKAAESSITVLAGTAEALPNSPDVNSISS